MNRDKVMGVVLAGGQARRMNYQDKGLIHYNGQPLVSYAIAALLPVVNDIVISANRHHKQYRTFGWPVIADESSDFEGPLAGLLAVMRHSDAEVLMVLPCDSPHFEARHCQKLLTLHASQQADAAVAFDGQRIHPVFLALRTTLLTQLQNYLAQGERKVAKWLEQINCVQGDFSDEPEIFVNMNSHADINKHSYQKNCG